MRRWRRLNMKVEKYEKVEHEGGEGRKSLNRKVEKEEKVVLEGGRLFVKAEKWVNKVQAKSV